MGSRLVEVRPPGVLLEVARGATSAAPALVLLAPAIALERLHAALGTLDTGV